MVDITRHNGVCIQVTERGRVYSSIDLETWRPLETDTLLSLRAVTSFGDRLIITGEAGTVLYADTLDSIKHGQLIDGTTYDWLEGLAASSNKVISVGDNGAIYSSTNGIHWSSINSPTTEWLRDVAFGQPGFVAVGENGAVITSNMGESWAIQSSGTQEHLNDIEWIGHSFFVAGNNGTVMSSPDGYAWSPIDTGATNSLYAIAGASTSSMVAAGDNEVRVKSGNTWQNALSVEFPPPREIYLSALASTNYFLLSGYTGTTVEGFNTNGAETIWFTLEDSPRNWIWDVLRLPEFYIAVGDRSTILTSDNGIDWTIEYPDKSTNSVFLGVGGDTNMLVIAGNKGTLLTSYNQWTNVVVTNTVGTNEISTNVNINTLGILWNTVTSPTSNDLQGVTVFNDKYYVSGGNGTIMSSVDGTNWTTHPTPTGAFLSSLATYPGGIVAVGADGSILSSTNGHDWRHVDSGTTNWIYRVRRLHDKLIAVGQNGLILQSTNAGTWSMIESPSNAWLNDVTRVDGTSFIAGTQGTMLTSTNGITWHEQKTITRKSLYSLATSNDQLIAAGIEGVILRTRLSQPGSPVDIIDFSRSQGTNNIGGKRDYNVFVFEGEPDQRFSLEAASSLTNREWMELKTLEILDSSGTLLHLEPATDDVSARSQFFRTRTPPIEE
ncbi:MAG: hypothetical protein K9N52_11295 [Verrucomicrobia bacterium]|nr:hypothetical protein [Verrucomicrobiota bacterium]